MKTLSLFVVNATVRGSKNIHKWGNIPNWWGDKILENDTKTRLIRILQAGMTLYNIMYPHHEEGAFLKIILSTLQVFLK